MKTDIEKQKELDRLRLKGDFHHNVSVMNNNTGTLIVCRRPGVESGEGYQPDDFIRCEYCRGFYLRWELWRHQKNCKFAKKNPVNKGSQPQRNGVIILENSKQTQHTDPKFTKVVISLMIIDPI